MSVIGDAAGELLELVGKLPPEAVGWLVKLVKGAVESDDPTRFIERRAEADASHAAARAAVEKALEELKR